MSPVVNRTLLLSLIAVSVALAGCTLPGGGQVDLGSALDNAGAAALLKAAASGNETGKRGMEMTIDKSGENLATFQSAADPAEGTQWMFLKAKPGAFGDDNGGDDGSAAFQYGVTIWVTKTASVYHVNKTAYALANGSSSNGMSNPSEGFDFDKEMLRDLKNATVKSVKLVAHKGKAAAEIDVTSKDDDNQVTNLTVTVYRDPARVARVTGISPGDPDKTNDPTKGATITMELRYGSEVVINPSETMTRAAALAYTSSDAYSAAGPKKTWTFASSGGIPLGELEIHVKDAPQESGHGHDGSGAGSEPKEPDKLTTAWSMKLSEKTKTQAGITLTFTDKDNDGKASRGDTLVVQYPLTGEQPMVVLFDAKTGTYVVPSVGAVAAILALLGLAFVRRR